MRHSRRLWPASLVLGVISALEFATAAHAQTETVVAMDWDHGAVADSTGDEVWKAADDATRPICLLDEQRGRVYVLAQVEAGSPDGIYYKSASLLTPTFSSGLGTPLITGNGKPNNVSSTKQNLSPAKGLVALASTPSTNHYWHAKVTFGQP